MVALVQWFVEQRILRILRIYDRISLLVYHCVPSLVCHSYTIDRISFTIRLPLLDRRCRINSSLRRLIASECSPLDLVRRRRFDHCIANPQTLIKLISVPQETRGRRLACESIRVYESLSEFTSVCQSQWESKFMSENFHCSKSSESLCVYIHHKSAYHSKDSVTGEPFTWSVPAGLRGYETVVECQKSKQRVKIENHNFCGCESSEAIR